MRRVTIELSDAQFALVHSAAEDTRQLRGFLDWTIEEEARFRLMHDLRRSAGNTYIRFPQAGSA